MAAIPGAMEAGLVNCVFWASMMIALTAAFFAAYPVNRYLLASGKGHALTHEYHGASGDVTGARRYIPSFSSAALAAVIVAFMLGGLVVSVAAETGGNEPDETGTRSASPDVGHKAERVRPCKSQCHGTRFAQSTASAIESTWRIQ